MPACFSGQSFEFHGPDANEWYKGTFTLRESVNRKVMVAAITECPVEKYVGKSDYAIYRFENGTLMLTARNPGIPMCRQVSTPRKRAGSRSNGSRTINFE